jgi:hypothetical protein
MSIERLCLEEAGHLVVRSPKYWQLVFTMYLSSLRDALSAKVLRASYFFCRHIDDVLDGDRYVSDDPKDYVYAILRAMHNESDGPEVVELYRFAVRHLISLANTRGEPDKLFRCVIEKAMLFDYKRAQTRRVLTGVELHQYYDDTFAPVMDLALMIAGSSLRSVDMPEAVNVQGHLYSVRDLDRDLRGGIINIPAEELAKSSINVGRPFGREEVLADPYLSKWVENEVRIYGEYLSGWRQKLTDSGARNVCIPLILQMEIFCRLYKLGLY